MLVTDAPPLPTTSPDTSSGSSPDAAPLVIEHSDGLDSLKIVTFPARMFLALGWLRAGTEKLISVDWWTGFELDRFLTIQRSHALPFMHPVIDAILAPAAILVAALVMATQFAIGAALVTGRQLRAAVCTGMLLNVTFVAMGVVNPSAFYLVLQLTLLAALGERRRAYADRRMRWIRVGICLAMAAIMLPMANTMHPAEVIDDPALMLATIAVLCASVDALRIIQTELVDPVN